MYHDLKPMGMISDLFKYTKMIIMTLISISFVNQAILDTQSMSVHVLDMILSLNVAPLSLNVGTGA
jgi:hypothetical protein